MDVAQNVASGVLLAVLLGLARQARAWWRQHKNSPRTSSNPLESPMGKPLPKPDIPLGNGSHRQLNDLLHELHSRANYPSPYAIARVLGVSRTTLYDAMSKAKLPTKDIAVRLALAYGAQISWGPTADQDEELDRIDRRASLLWDSAYKEAQQLDPDQVKNVVQEVWEDMVRGRGPYPPSHALIGAMTKATISITVTVSPPCVFVLVYTPDEDARRTLGCLTEGNVSSYPWRHDVAAEARSRLAPARISVFSVDVAEDAPLDSWP